MPHDRKRQLLPQLEKRLRYSRVVSIQGARQVGKSFLARVLFAKKRSGSTYLSLDLPSVRDFARDNPMNFLESHEGRPLIIDEAQKAPDLFDVIKWRVDRDSSPGQYILLGSTEFSKELRIKESLTGRLSRVRLYSMNVGECEEMDLAPSSSFLLKEKPRVTRKVVLRHFARGGLPGIFWVHDAGLRKEAFNDWLRLTVERDIHQFPTLKVDSDLSYSVLEQIARLEEPSNPNIARALSCDVRACAKILNLLEILFVVHRLNPHPLGTGKPLYFLCDVGLTTHLGANFERQLWTWCLHEQLSQRSYGGETASHLSFFRNSKGRVLHLIIENQKEMGALKILSTERWDKRDLELLKSFEKKVGQTRLRARLTVLGNERISLRKERIEMYPYEALA